MMQFSKLILDESQERKTPGGKTARSPSKTHNKNISPSYLNTKYSNNSYNRRYDIVMESI